MRTNKVAYFKKHAPMAFLFTLLILNYFFGSFNHYDLANGQTDRDNNMISKGKPISSSLSLDNNTTIDNNTYENVIQLNNSTGNSDFPQATVIGSNIYVVWEESGNDSTGNSEIYFTKSQNNGELGNKTNLSNSTGDSLDPQISVNDNRINIIWKDDMTGDFDIYFVKSEDNGITFDDVINISTTFGNSVSAKIASFGSYIYIVWKDYLVSSPTRSEIFFIHSANGGNSFGNAKDISKTPGESLDPRISVYENNVYVTWIDTYSGTGNVLFTRSQNYGEDFDVNINLSNNNGESSFPQIASVGLLSGNQVFTSWNTRDINTGQTNIYFTSSSNNGATFPAAMNLSKSDYDSRFLDLIASQRGSVFVVWSEMQTPYNSKILFDRVI